MLLGWIIGTLLAAPFLAAALNLLPKPWRGPLMPLPALAAFALFAEAGWRYLHQGAALQESWEWFPQLGLSFSLYLSGWGLLLGLLVTGIGTLIVVYAGGYMGKEASAGRLLILLYVFMLAMAGIAVSDHLILLFVFWELTSISSYLLIGFNHTREDARRNALQALLVTGLGGMAMLAGIVLLAGISGTWLLSELPSWREAIVSDPQYPAILLLFLLGALTKSAQFPFHFWLPNAMSAPTPVSAYLHSATMVKAGVFLLAVMLPVLGGTLLWTAMLVPAGGVTLLVGAWFAIQQHDLKRILAGTTLAVLGVITLLLGIGTKTALLAAVLFFTGHALYKAALFMVAGAVDHGTGTRDIRHLGGLARWMPWTATAALLAALSKMGIPLFFGFLGKEYAYKASLEGPMSWAVTAVLLVGNGLLLALAIKVAILPFFGRSRTEYAHEPHEVPWSMLLGPLVLATLGIVLGIAPMLFAPVASATVSGSLAVPTVTEIKLWQGINLPLILSVLTVALGIALVSTGDFWKRLLGRLRLPSPESGYNFLFDATLTGASLLTRLLQSGLLRNYLLIILGATSFLVGIKLWRFGGWSELSELSSVPLPLAVVAPLMMVAAVYASLTPSRLIALISLGVVGFGGALIFALYSAPDLAITQIIVETLTVVLFAWVVYRIPAYRLYSSVRTRLFDAAVAGLAGVLITILVLKSKAVDLGDRISEQLTAWSLSEAYGANVVNVILVDFRALDTWGEIGVLAIAAIGVSALLLGARRGGKKGAGS